MCNDIRIGESEFVNGLIVIGNRCAKEFIKV